MGKMRNVKNIKRLDEFLILENINFQKETSIQHPNDIKDQILINIINFCHI